MNVSSGQQISKEATHVLRVIQSAKVPFQLEYCFKDLTGKLGVPYRFDFAIFAPDGSLICLIEYDSLLHFDERLGRRELMQYRERDLKKNEYCLAHHIPLYRISYWDLNDVKEYNDLFQDKYLVKSKWHNYNLARQHKLL